jgi:hypothetical protein
LLVYTKTHVAVPCFLFTVRIVTGVIIALLALLRLTGFLSLYIGPENGLRKGHALIAPKLLVGLLGLSGFTCCCHERLAIAAIAMAVQGVAGLVGTAMGFATLAKLLSLVRDSDFRFSFLGPPSEADLRFNF